MNGKCFCGTPKCIGTLFPRIIRDDQESGDEGENEAGIQDGEGRSEIEQQDGGEEERGDGDGEADEGREIGAGKDVHMDL